MCGKRVFAELARGMPIAIRQKGSVQGRFWGVFSQALDAAVTSGMTGGKG